MYRQQVVCEAGGVEFASKVDIMADIISTFVPVAGKDDQTEKGWRWQRVDEYADALPETAWQRVCWPNQNGQRWVYVHVVPTRIKKLYRCQLVIARGQWDDDEAESRRKPLSEKCKDNDFFLGRNSSKEAQQYEIW